MRVALTGGVASGKSTVAGVLAELGLVVVDADRLAREVVEPGTPGLAAVRRAFGEEVLTAEGALDRPALGRGVFADPAARKRLEAILHPLIRARAAALEAEVPPGDVVVLDIPLLVESGRLDSGDPEDRFDAVLVVDVPVATQLERMQRDRGWSRTDADARVAAQAGRAERLAAATHVIDNTGTLDDLRDQVTEVVEGLVSSGG